MTKDIAKPHSSAKSKKNQNSSLNTSNKDTLLALQMVANQQRGIDSFGVFESALSTIIASKFPPGTDLRVSIDRRTGEYIVLRRWKVVQDETALNSTLEEKNVNQISLREAQQHEALIKAGDIFEKEISVDFSRVDARQAKQMIGAEIEKAKRYQVVERYQNQIGKVFTAIQKKSFLNREGIVLELLDGSDTLSPTEVLLPHADRIPKEDIRLGDRLYVHLSQVNENQKGPQLQVSRTSPELLLELLKIKIPEIESGIIEVKSIARDPGGRSKVAVKTNDGRLNPIGTCIGRSGTRIQAVSNELNGEHIDILLWDENPAQMVINIFEPIQVSSIVMDEDTNMMDIVVSNEDVPRAIGEGGQNVKLASKLIGWTLNILRSEEADRKTEANLAQLINVFAEQLQISPELARTLVQKDFSHLEEISAISSMELSLLLDITQEDATRLIDTAKKALKIERTVDNALNFQDNYTEDEKKFLKTLPETLLNVLNERKMPAVKTLAELDTEELLEMLPKDLITREAAGQIIMKARKLLF